MLCSCGGILLSGDASLPPTNHGRTRLDMFCSLRGTVAWCIMLVVNAPPLEIVLRRQIPRSSKYSSTSTASSHSPCSRAKDVSMIVLVLPLTICFTNGAGALGTVFVPPSTTRYICGCRGAEWNGYLKSITEAWKRDSACRELIIRASSPSN